MHLTIAAYLRDVWIDFKNDGTRLGDRGHRVVGGQTERKITLVVHFRCHRNNDIGPIDPLVDEMRYFVEMVGDEVDPAGVPARARDSAEEIRGMPDVFGGLRIEIGKFAKRQGLCDANIAQGAPLLGQCLEQGWRFADSGRHDDYIVVVDKAYCHVRRGQLFLVLVFYGHSLPLD